MDREKVRTGAKMKMRQKISSPFSKDMVSLVISVPVAYTDRRMLLDVEDYQRFQYLKFFLVKGYVKVSVNGGFTGIHRLIMDAPPELDVDHKNHDPFDNQRCNLRLATRSQNLFNRRKLVPTSSRYKGVTKLANGKFMSRVSKDQKQINLGTFDSEEDAARMYDQGAFDSAGEFAYLNFPEEDNTHLTKPEKKRYSQYHGVTFNKRSGKWTAYVWHNGKNKHAGVFDKEIDAAIAHDDLAHETFGEAALLNFPVHYDSEEDL